MAASNGIEPTPRTASFGLFAGTSAGSASLHPGDVGEGHSHDGALGGHAAGVMPGVVELERAAAIDRESAGALIGEVERIRGLGVGGSGAVLLIGAIDVGQ